LQVVENIEDAQKLQVENIVDAQKLQVVENIVDAHKLQLSKYDEDQKLLSLQNVRAWFKSMHVPEEELDKYCFTMEDFQGALQECIPYSKREGFASVPNTTWEDIGALEDIKEELRSTIMWPVQYRKFYEENKLSSTKGILLYGPKGCGKTLLAKAIANECSINFLSVNGPELLSMYVGESEKAVRKCFERARNSAPCVIFFDEFDALCPPRSSTKENAPVERVVNQLLTETCGMQERKQVFLVAATNRLEKIDSAMLRPGRLEKILYVGLPSPSGRAEILKSLTKNKTCPKIEEELELETIAFDSRCENFSGADLAYLVREATTKAIKERISSSLHLESLVLSMRHFDEALKVVKPSFSEQDRKYFQRTSSHFSTG
ncbi:nuclear valosin-containing protein-like, partial [Trichonephila inaurata madagascariensis]